MMRDSCDSLCCLFSYMLMKQSAPILPDELMHKPPQTKTHWQCTIFFYLFIFIYLFFLIIHNQLMGRSFAHRNQVKVSPHAKNQGRGRNSSRKRVPPNGRVDGCYRMYYLPTMHSIISNTGINQLGAMKIIQN